MNFLTKKNEQYFTHWFLKSEVDLFKGKMEEQIRKEAPYDIAYLNFEELDCVPDFVNGKEQELVKYAVYVGYEIADDIRIVSI